MQIGHEIINEISSTIGKKQMWTRGGTGNEDKR